MSNSERGQTVRFGLRWPGRERFVLLAALSLLAMFFGCSGGSSGTQAEPRLVVLNFNQNRQPSVLMNSPLVFTFSAPVDPATVNSNTLQIWTNIQGKRVDAQGAFEVNGATVTWFPSMTSKVYPLNVSSLPPNSAILPGDAGLNTLDRAILSYQVLVLASPSPSVVRSVTGNPVQEAFSSSFDTIQGQISFGEHNFSNKFWTVGQWQDGVFYGVTGSNMPGEKPVRDFASARACLTACFVPSR